MFLHSINATSIRWRRKLLEPNLFCAREKEVLVPFSFVWLLLQETSIALGESQEALSFADPTQSMPIRAACMLMSPGIFAFPGFIP